MASQPIVGLTEQDYLALERAAEFKSEFVDGEMYAMSGGTSRHSYLAMKLGFELMGQLKGRKCMVFNSDMRVRIAKSKNYLYPDLSVVCVLAVTSEFGAWTQFSFDLAVPSS